MEAEGQTCHPQDATPARFDASYEAQTGSLSEVRRDLRSFLGEHHASPEATSDAQLALGELAANAVRASDGGTFAVRFEVSDGAVQIQVTNTASLDDLPPPSQWRPVDTLAIGGRGLGIVRTLAQSMTITEDRGRVTISAHLPL